MIDIKFLRENPQRVKDACKAKKSAADVDVILELDAVKRKKAVEVEEINRQANEAAKARDVARGKELKKRHAGAQQELDEAESKLIEELKKVPNIPSEDTPVGPDESGNVVLRV
ncbi:serine--tRNA ligase, partial [Candidatus Uhrbacteria bacterium]|nr:serine--tRNA ligase [Candidatus Uhrbacteria bacterium]